MRKAAGLCIRCGKNPAVPDRTRCGGCAERHNACDAGRRQGNIGRQLAQAPTPKKRAPLSFPAKKEGDCRKCRRLIILGTMIRRCGLGWAHLECPPRAKVERARKSAAEIRLEAARDFFAHVAERPLRLLDSAPKKSV
jgi:hypothetical protein